MKIQDGLNNNMSRQEKHVYNSSLIQNNPSQIEVQAAKEKVANLKMNHSYSSLEEKTIEL